MRFAYQARTKEGEVQTGFVEASSREAAAAVLQNYGLYVSYLSELKEPLWHRRIGFFSEASRGDIIFFTRQLAIMLKSNIPVVESLETIARQVKKIGFQEKIYKTAEEVEGGLSLSLALSKFPQSFSRLFIGMVKTGEASGTLPESLEYLADYLEREQEFSSKFLGSLIYPAFVLLVFFVVLFLMAVMVVPKFAEFFEEMGSDLPFLTKMVINVSGFLENWWWIFALTFFSLVFLIGFLVRTREGRESLDETVLNIPLLGEIIQKVCLARMAMNLATLIAGGVSISQALELTANSVGNDVYKRLVLEAREGVRAGKPLSSTFFNHPERFPLLFVQMTVVGEKTGRLEGSFKNMVDFYQKEVDRALENFIRILEPSMIIILGLLVTFVAIAIYLPLFGKGLMPT